jgi:hypothetical protein
VKREPPTSAELARLFRLPPPEPTFTERLEQLEAEAHRLRAGSGSISLDKPIGDDPDGPPMSAFIYYRRQRDPLEELLHAEEEGSWRWR